MPSRTLYGVLPSPFVRKVRACLHYKKLAFSSISVMPGDSRKTFRSISPLGKIPGYREGALKLCDSSVICAYLEKVYPNPSLYPEDPQSYAKALWIEEYADAIMSQSLTNILMYQCLLAPAFLKKPTDFELVNKTLTEAVPEIFNFIQSNFISCRPFLVGKALSIADISLTTQLLSFIYSGHEIDGEDFPQLKTYFEQMLKTSPFPRLLQEENYPNFKIFL